MGLLLVSGQPRMGLFSICWMVVPIVVSFWKRARTTSSLFELRAHLIKELLGAPWLPPALVLNLSKGCPCAPRRDGVSRCPDAAAASAKRRQIMAQPKRQRERKQSLPRAAPSGAGPLNPHPVVLRVSFVLCSARFR